MRFVVLILIILIQYAAAKDLGTIHFIKAFIENEHKPTQLVYNLCWKKDIEIALVTEITKLGVPCSTSWTAFKYLDHHTLFLVDLDCSESENILRISGSLFRSPYRWLAITNSTLNSSILCDSPILGDSDFVLAQKTVDGYRMTELFKTSPTSEMLETPRGYFNGSLIDTRPHRELFRRRKDVMGQPITMINVIQDSNTTRYHLPREDRLEPQYDAIAKISWNQVRIAFEMLNATPRYTFAYRWGYQRNGSWDGMINDLRTGKGDIGTNCLVMENRLEVVTYIDVLCNFNVNFIFRQPPLSYISNIFSLPFSTNVWYAMVLVSVLSTFAVFLASQHEVKFGKSPTQLNGIGDALLLTMSAVSQQGCLMEPRKASGRIMVWIMFAALMALYAAYSANIVVLLRAPSNSINSLSQLASSKLTIAAHDVDYSYVFFKILKDPVRLEILKKLEPAKGKRNFYSMEEGVERIRQGLFAFHAIVDPVYRRIEQTFLENEKCDLTEVNYRNDFPPFTPIKKDSPYLELLRVVFKQIKESGIHQANYKRLQVPKPKCASKGAAFSSVGLLDIRPIIFLEVFGIALSVIILIVEIIVFKLNNRWREQEIFN